MLRQGLQKLFNFNLYFKKIMNKNYLNFEMNIAYYLNINSFNLCYE